MMKSVFNIKCLKCGSKHVVKRGKRKRNFGSVQAYYCKECGRSFVDKTFQHRTYPIRIVFNALNYYNLGYSLDETSKILNKKFKVRTCKTTVYYWIKKFQRFSPISSLRNNFLNYDDVLFTKRFEHENLEYEFMYHKYKLDTFVRGKFPGLADYIVRFEGGCPDVFFEIGERCSQPRFMVDVHVTSKKNLACMLAGFAVLTAKDNRERHNLVEELMVINDKATVACEVPVWYWEKSIDDGVTGHIDILQVRGGNVYILDYKPGASKDKKAVQQLYHYAVALSFRAKIPFDRIMCAWFDEKSYYEFNLAEADATLIKK
ncbi:MAG: IS1 family transposase [Thermoplasmatales archaeon]|nr:IS1 family transposase [Thermoplasmatales archaeon]